MKRILLLSILSSLGLHAAIKKAEDPKPSAAPKVEQSKPKPEGNDDAGSLLEELLRRREKGGDKLDLDSANFEKFMRDLLEKQGVPKEETQGNSLMDLLKKLREKNPFGGDGGMGIPFMDRKTEEKLNGHFKELLDGSRPGAAKAAPATFTLRAGLKKQAEVALATAVRADGWLLTKASEVTEVKNLQLQVKGAWVPAKVVRTWDDHDLALIKAEATDLPTVQWTTQPAPGVGTFLTAVAPAGTDPLSLGVVSVATRNLQTKGRGFLGVQLDADEKGVKVRDIVPGGAANAAGVQKEDRILEIDGQKPDSVFTFTRLVSERKAGDKVKLKLQRGEAVVDKEIQLGDRGTLAGLGGQRQQRFDLMNEMGSTISKRRDNFPAVVQTDLPLQANQCGGPVTDLDGNVVGMVIARSGRIETLVIPSEVIRKTLDSIDFAKEATKK